MMAIEEEERKAVESTPIVQYDPRSRISAKYLRYEDIAGPVITSFNQYLEMTKEMINNTEINLGERGTITLENTAIFNPTMSDVTREHTPKMPNFCRLYDRTYGGEIMTTARLGDQTVQLSLGPIPIMLRSQNCNLARLSNEMLTSARECPNDPFGYFIVKGAEKIIAMQERASPNHIMTYRIPKEDDQITTEIRCVAPDGRKVKVGVRLMKKEDDDLSETKRGKISKPIINVSVGSYFDETEINVCAIYEILGILNLPPPSDENLEPENIFLDTANIQAYVLDWVEPEDRRAVADYFDHTLEAYVAGIRGKAIGYIASKLKLAVKGLQVDQIKTDILRKIDSELFVNMIDDGYGKRAEMLSLLVARFISTSLGIRGKRINPIETDGVRDLAVLIQKGLDDRDDYANKIIDTPGSLLAFLTSQAWRKQVSDVTNDLLELLKQPNLLAELQSSMPKHYVMRDVLTKAIRSGNWGMPNQKQHTAITRTIQRDSIIGSIADVRSIKAPIPPESHDPRPRSVHLTYYGFICPTSTKEGADCGLGKSLSQASTISVRTQFDLVDDFVSDYVSESRLLEDESGNPLPAEEERVTALIVNGRFKGWCNKERLREAFLVARRGVNGEARAIPQGVNISYDLDGILQIHGGEGRLIRPVFVVDVETQELVMDLKNLWDEDWATIVEQGGAEFIDSAEQKDCLIAVNISDLGVPVRGLPPSEAGSYADLRNPDITHIPQYTHVELDPALLYSYEANVAPFASMNPGTRITYESNMAKHAAGVSSSAYQMIPATKETPAIPGRFESSKQLAYPQRPLATTDVYDRISSGVSFDTPGLLEAIAKLPSSVTDEEIEEIKRRVREATSTDLFGATGQNAIVAVLSANPGSWHEEDAMMLNKRFIDNGGFMTTTYKSDSYEVENANVEKRGIPPNLKEENLPLFSAIDPKTGIARIGSVLRAGMAIIAKYTEEGGKVRDTSIYLKEQDSLTPAEIRQASSTKVKRRGGAPKSVLSTSISNEPIMDDVLVGQDGEGKTFVKWKIRVTRRPQPGDKFASRFSQKGIVGMVLYPEDMPWTQEGISPDLIMNPHAFPSRMTIGHLVESITGKAGALLGERLNGTAFRDVDMESLKRILNVFGFNGTGDEVLYDGHTGMPLKAMVFQGPVFYQVLKHMVEEKKHGRARGDVNHLYRQPTEGRSRNGGLRLGEMERDAFIAHGARGWLRDRYFKVSDPAKMAICETCQLQAIGDFNSHQPYTHCALCGEGAKIGEISAPTSFRLLVQYQAAMNIKVSMRTGPVARRLK